MTDKQLAYAQALARKQGISPGLLLDVAWVGAQWHPPVAKSPYLPRPADFSLRSLSRDDSSRLISMLLEKSILDFYVEIVRNYWKGRTS